MNTKQLWNALCLNPVTNQYFDGIYSADTLKEIREKPDLIICNTDPSNKPGEHWVLFFFSDNGVDFFDSLGRDIKYYGSIFLDFIANFVTNYEQSLQRMQPLKSDLCGQYCLYYAFVKCNGLSMDEIIYNIPNYKDVVNFVNRLFYICPKYKCSLVQCCNCISYRKNKKLCTDQFYLFVFFSQYYFFCNTILLRKSHCLNKTETIF